MIGILTFYWADDYGAMLQAYALKRTIEAGGQAAEMIPYAPLQMPSRYWWCPLASKLVNGKIHYWPSRSGWKRNVRMGLAFWKRRSGMRRFRRAYLTAKLPVRKAKHLSIEKYDWVFVGSDQVWNPAITLGLDDAYLGNIQKRGGCRMVSYGASFGGSSLPQEYWEKFTEQAGKNFSAISVREKSAVSFVEKLLKRPVTDVLDPTLLLLREEWEKIGKKPREENYILIYCTEYNQDMMDYLEALSKRLGQKVVQVSLPMQNRGPEWLELRCGGGPAEFIGYFQHASCVVTNSFHGTSFSLLMEKQFLVFKHSTRNARLANLLEKAGLEGRMKGPGEETGDIFAEIPWEQVRRRLEGEKRRSRQFILENMGVREI